MSANQTRGKRGARRPARSNPNKDLLDEVNARKANGWFHVRKVAPVWAYKLEEDTIVETLEGQERAKAGDMLCKGVAGELWPQKEERLLSKYKPTNTQNGKWRKYVPDLASPGFFAIQVMHPFEVKTSYGTMHAKKGDYLIKNFDDQNTAYPSDVWVVAKGLFWKTYQKVFTQNDVMVAVNFMQMCSA
ncbi:hypothetical protein QOT17_008334 [Balamuthia mandrillaris]